jgi:hypothetical protein
MRTVQHLLLQIGDGTWQDVMLSAGNILFCITFIPMLRQPERPPLLTCIPTGLALVAGGFVFATLHLWLTALTQTISGLQWLALVFKRSPKAASSLTRNLGANGRTLLDTEHCKPMNSALRIEDGNIRYTTSRGR